MRIKNSFVLLTGIICSLILSSGCNHNAEDYTRGVGIYPGNPSEDFSPTLVADNENYRNIAKLRAAYHSSSYDYNLTAQLVTDGIITDEMPDYIALSTNQGVLPKNEREWLFDEKVATEVSIDGKDIWIQLDLNQSKDIPEITKISLVGSVDYSDKTQGGWQINCSGSNDGLKWDELGEFKGNGLPGQEKLNPFAAMLANMAKGKIGKRPPNPFAGPSDADS